MKNKDFTKVDKFTLGTETLNGNNHAHDISPYMHIQNENKEDEVEASEVDLKSFNKQDHLERNLWNNEKLDSRARLTLMDIADDFWETCNVKWVKPEGVLLVGSICNYNWSEFSDIDLHLIVDFKKVHKRTDFVQDYFNEKKNDWNNNHKSLKIYGFPIEVYVQDVNADIESGGIYDLWNNKWLREPKEGTLKSIEKDKIKIKRLAADLMTKIDDLSDAFKHESDSHKIEILQTKSYKLLKKINKIRKKGLKKGEMGLGNIVYKCLRRFGYLDKLWKLQEKMYDKTNSIEESYEFSRSIRKSF